MTFQLSESDYRETEGPNAAMQVIISKVADIFLATPVLFIVIPMTVDRALDLDVIDSFEPLDLSSNRAGRKCLNSQHGVLPIVN